MTDNSPLEHLLNEHAIRRLADISPTLQGLFHLGQLNALSQSGLAIVGSRRASLQGIADAHHFGAIAAATGLPVISGLATGIDAAAHRGALSVGGTTIAVLAHGLDQTYPSRHRLLAEEILNKGGLLLSEYPDGTPPRPYQFPLRNRIIAGLSRGICLIEAAQGSGSLITALYGLQMGVDVAVVPGSIHDPLVAGGLGLIRQGAALVRSPQEWLADLGIVCPSGQAKGANPATPAAAASLWSGTEDDRATALWQSLKASPQGIDELCATSGRSAADAQAGLLILELQGRAFRTPSGQWQRFSGPGVF